MKKFIISSEKDNVAVALENVLSGEAAQLISKANQNIGIIEVKEDIPFGNKIALCDINKNDDVVKCGYFIGKSSADISKGQWVHVHNVRSERINFPDSIINEILRQMGK